MLVAIKAPGARQNSFLIQQHTVANVVLHHFCELLFVRLAEHARPSTPVFALRVLWNVTAGECTHHFLKETLRISYTLVIPSACEFVNGDCRVFRPIRSRSALSFDHRASRLTLSSFVILFTLLRNAFRLTKPRSLLAV